MECSYVSQSCSDDKFLMECKNEKITWIVEGLLPRGLVLLAGKPKSGKSYLCLDLAMHIAEGKEFLGYRTSKSEVLYLSLEDDFIILSHRRSRLSDKSFIEGIYYRESFPKGNDAIQEIKKIVNGSPNLKLIIVDILGCILPYNNAEQSNQYDFISNALDQFRSILKGNGVCMLLVHHTSKRDYSSSQDKILGSTAYQAKVDTFWILENKGNTTILSVNGKHFDGEREIILSRSSNGSFHKIGSSEKILSEKEKVLNIVNSSMTPVSPKLMSEKLNKSIQIVTQNLFRLFKEGLITKVGKGQYVSLDYEQRIKSYSPFNG